MGVSPKVDMKAYMFSTEVIAQQHQIYVVDKNYVMKQSESLLHSSFELVKRPNDPRSVVAASCTDPNCSANIAPCLLDFSCHASVSKYVQAVLTVLLYNATFS